jgi:antitoxin HicB
MNKKDKTYYMGLPYRIVIQKDPYGGFFAEIEELEGCMTQGETYEEAYSNILEAMEGWLEVAVERGIDIPEPESESQYSGKFTLRIPKSLHRKLAQMAKRENVSLNQYAIHLLSERSALHFGK